MPENLADLIARVKATGAEMGIALDGDADRVGAVDGQGRIIWGDQLVMLFAREILQRIPGATFVSEVKCSQALFDDIAARGGRPIMWKVGHSLIKAKMKEEKAALAGEMSGHMFFADRWFGFDDAVYAGLRLIELLTHSDKTLAQLYDTLPVLHNTPEIRMPCPDDVKFEVVKRAVAWFRERYAVVDVDGVARPVRRARQARRLGTGTSVEHRPGAGHALRGGYAGAAGRDSRADGGTSSERSSPKSEPDGRGRETSGSVATTFLGPATRRFSPPMSPARTASPRTLRPARCPAPPAPCGRGRS